MNYSFMKTEQSDKKENNVYTWTFRCSQYECETLPKGRRYAIGILLAATRHMMGNKQSLMMGLRDEFPMLSGLKAPWEPVKAVISLVSLAGLDEE